MLYTSPALLLISRYSVQKMAPAVILCAVICFSNLGRRHELCVLWPDVSGGHIGIGTYHQTS